MSRRSLLRLEHVLPSFGKTQVSNNDQIIVQKTIVHLEISMHDFVLVAVVDGVEDLLNDCGCFLLGKASPGDYFVKKLPAFADFSDYIVTRIGP